MKRIATTLILVFVSALTLSAQDLTPQDTIATFKVDNSDDVVLSSKDDGISINVAGYKISLSDAKSKKTNEQSQLSIGLHGTYISKVELEDDNFTAKKQKRSKFSIASNSKLGVIMLTKPNYSLYGADQQDFMDLRASKSIYFGLDVASLQMPLNQSQSISLKTGINLMCYNFTFADDITLNYQNNMITPVAIDSSNKKSKLTTAYAAIPLSISFNITKHFTIEPGIYAGILINSHTKYKKPKVKSDFLRGTNDAIAGASLVLDYAGYALYCDYNFSTLFEQGRGPETKALTVGIKFNL